MPFYKDLKHPPAIAPVADPKFVADRLLALRETLDAIPRRDLERTLIVATWNIRDFDSNKFGQGPRRPESFHYIAEVLARFDICAVQEVNDDMGPLERVMRLLGPSYDYMVTDITVGRSGNNERLAFVYDTRKIRFRNLVGEVVLEKGAGADGKQFARTPFLAAFQGGWFKFTICTVHIYYGAESRNSAEYRRRVAEIEELSKFFGRKADKDKQNYILLGDFNIVSETDPTMAALQSGGFFMPAQLTGSRSNLGGDRAYDQIAFRGQPWELKFLKASVFDWRRSVFRDEDFALYEAAMPADDDEGEALAPAAREAHYRGKWRTWQMSDHLPMWVQLEVDFSDAYLQKIRAGMD